MTIEAAAEALAPEPVTPALEDDLGAVWDKMQEVPDNSPEEPKQEVEAEVQEEPAEEPETPQEATEEAKEPEPEAPGGLPRGLKEHWSKIPEEARGEFQRVLKDWNDKLSEQGRQVQGIAPIRDELVNLVKDVPQYAGMRPADVAADLRAFRNNVIVPLETKPVETLLKVAQERGIAEQLRAALGGEQSQGGQQAQQMAQTIQQLQRKIEQLENPEYWSERVGQITQQTTLQSEVQQFAAEAEHWEDVETHIPAVVPVMRAKLGESASAKDVLEAAYNEAVRLFVPNAEKAPEPAAVEEAAAVTDPEQAEKARKAKSVNVTGGPSKKRQLTEDELLTQAWDRAQKK